MMLKKKVDGLEDYYYQWMNKYKDDADRRGELLRRSKDYLDEWFTWLEENTAKDIDDLMDLALDIEKELADA